MEEILEILEKNSRYSDEKIALMTGKTVEEVREAITDYEEKNIIAGYTTLNLYILSATLSKPTPLCGVIFTSIKAVTVSLPVFSQFIKEI